MYFYSLIRILITVTYEKFENAIKNQNKDIIFLWYLYENDKEYFTLYVYIFIIKFITIYICYHILKLYLNSHLINSPKRLSLL